jgi:preprotein translocase subunit YajC
VLIAQEAGGSGLPSLLFFAVLLFGLYLLVIRPQRSRARQLAAVRSRLEIGTQVITTAGLHAQVVGLPDDGTVLLEIAPGVTARFLGQAVVQVVDEPTDADEPVDPRPDDPA